MLVGVGSDDIGRGCLHAAVTWCVLRNWETVEKMRRFQAPDPKGLAGVNVPERPGADGRHGWQVKGAVALALPKAVRLCLVAGVQPGCTFSSANPIATGDGVEQHATSWVVGFGAMLAIGGEKFSCRSRHPAPGHNNHHQLPATIQTEDWPRCGSGPERKAGSERFLKRTVGRSPAFPFRYVPADVGEDGDDAPDWSMRSSIVCLAVPRRCAQKCEARLAGRGVGGPRSQSTPPTSFSDLRRGDSNEGVVPLVNDGGDCVGAAACPIGQG